MQYLFDEDNTLQYGFYLICTINHHTFCYNSKKVTGDTLIDFKGKAEIDIQYFFTAILVIFSIIYQNVLKEENRRAKVNETKPMSTVFTSFVCRSKCYTFE